MTDSTERPGRATHLLRHAAVAAGALALAWASLHALVDRAAVRERIRVQAIQLLEARLPGAVLGDDVRVDWLFRASVGPLTVPAVAPGAPPVLGVGRITVRAAWWPLLSGRIEPASVRLLGVRLVPGPDLKEALRLVESAGVRRSGRAAATAPVSGADPAIRIRDLTVALERGGKHYEVGPFDADVERHRDAAQELVTGELRLPGGGRAVATLRRPRAAIAPPPAGDRAGSAGAKALAGSGAASGPLAPPGPGRGEGAWSLSARFQAGVADLPAWLRRRAITATAGAAALEVEAEGHEEGMVASLRGSATGLTLAGAPLGTEPVGPLRLDGDGTVAFTRSDGRVTVERATLRLGGPVTVRLGGTLSTRGDLPFEASVELVPVDYLALLAALPSALQPPPEAPRPGGAVGGAATLSAALRGGRPWSLQASVDLAGMKEAARASPPSPLRLPFTAHPPGQGGQPGTTDPAGRSGSEGPAIVIGPENPAFVPIAELPEHVVRCITTSEDAGFFGHQGFDFDELRNAAAAGAQAGRLLRGGSTITQQLAKNLYLSRDRSLTRKAREALITLALEGTVPKARLLEIYLNVIEWGPELYGIGRAARHYLDKDARTLTPREACFLATLIPSPVRSHGALAAGVPISRWSERIDDLLRKLHTVGLLDDAGLARELSAPLLPASWVPRQPGPAGAEPLPVAEPDPDDAAGTEEPDQAEPPGPLPRPAPPPETPGPPQRPGDSPPVGPLAGPAP